MSEEQLERVLRAVPVDRREFIKRVVGGTAFAIPLVASFEMAAPALGLTSTSNQTSGGGTTLTSNQTSGGGTTAQCGPRKTAVVAGAKPYVATLVTTSAGEQPAWIHNMAATALADLDACELKAAATTLRKLRARIRLAIQSGKLSAAFVRQQRYIYDINQALAVLHNAGY